MSPRSPELASGAKTALASALLLLAINCTKQISVTCPEGETMQGVVLTLERGVSDIICKTQQEKAQNKLVQQCPPGTFLSTDSKTDAGLACESSAIGLVAIEALKDRALTVVPCMPTIDDAEICHEPEHVLGRLQAAIDSTHLTAERLDALGFSKSVLAFRDNVEATATFYVMGTNSFKIIGTDRFIFTTKAPVTKTTTDGHIYQVTPVTVSNLSPSTPNLEVTYMGYVTPPNKPVIIIPISIINPSKAAIPHM